MHRAAYERARPRLDLRGHRGGAGRSRGVPRLPGRRLARPVADDAAEADRRTPAGRPRRARTPLAGCQHPPADRGAPTRVQHRHPGCRDRDGRSSRGAGRVGRGAGGRCDGDLRAVRARRPGVCGGPGRRPGPGPGRADGGDRGPSPDAARPRGRSPSTTSRRSPATSSSRRSRRPRRRRSSWRRSLPSLPCSTSSTTRGPRPWRRRRSSPSATFISGIELLGYQAELQVEIMTGRRVDAGPADRVRVGRAGAPCCAERPTRRPGPLTCGRGLLTAGRGRARAPCCAVRSLSASRR